MPSVFNDGQKGHGVNIGYSTAGESPWWWGRVVSNVSIAHRVAGGIALALGPKDPASA